MISKRLQIDEENANNRIDIFLSRSFDSISRGIVQDLIDEGRVLVNGKMVERDYKTKINDVIEIEFNLETNNEDLAQDIQISVAFENNDFLIIDKHAGLTVHPGAGQKDSTLINGLLHMYPDQRKIPRYGVVHRLDKDTSGLMIIARTLESHKNNNQWVSTKKDYDDKKIKNIIKAWENAVAVRVSKYQINDGSSEKDCDYNKSCNPAISIETISGEIISFSIEKEKPNLVLARESVYIQYTISADDSRQMF